MKLNFPAYTFRIKEENGLQFIFDELRGKYVALTPEEWVRQHLVRYLIDEKKYPRSLMAPEYPVPVGTLNQRADLVVCNNEGKPLLIAECKAPEVDITQKTFDQISVYSLTLNVTYLILTNGLKHFCCKMDLEKKRFVFRNDIPDYSEIIEG